MAMPDPHGSLQGFRLSGFGIGVSPEDRIVGGQMKVLRTSEFGLKL